MPSKGIVYLEGDGPSGAGFGGAELKQRPLFGRRVVVTQRGDLACSLATLLREQGAEVLEVPATHWGPPPDTKPLDQALARLKSYDWILFSHPIGMEVFFEHFFKIHGGVRQLGGVRLGTYGPVTGRKLHEWHLQPAAVAADHKTPLIMDAVTKCGDVRGQKFLVLRGESGHEKVPEALEKLGAVVDVVPSYGAKPETEDATGDAARLIGKGADWIVFASGLAIKHFHTRFDLPRLMTRFPNTRLAIASITIKWALDQLALSPSVVARPDDIESVASGIARFESEKEASKTADRDGGV